MIGIYKITSPSERVYIGESINIKRRWKEYFNLFCIKQTRLYNSFSKYGVDSHKFEIIEECEVDKLNERERYWQDYYDVLGKNGLNCKLTETGSKKRVISKETSFKISRSNLGRKHSKETKDKISKKAKLRVRIKKEKPKKEVKIRTAHNRCLIFNTETGIYYECIQDASFSIDKKYSYLIYRLNCKCKNNTSLIYADDNKNNEYINKFYNFKNRNKYIKTKEHILKIKKSIKENGTIFKGKQVIDLSTGVVYSSIKQASFAYSLKYDTLKRYLDGRLKNRTNLIILT